MFSLNYAVQSLRLFFRYPYAVTGFVSGRTASDVIDQKRREKWQQIKGEYTDNPKHCNGFYIFLNPNDDSAVSSSIAARGWLNLALTELFRKTVKRGMNVVDVGANLGYYTLLAAGLVGDSGSVTTFEPEPNNYALLVKSISINNLRNITAEKLALSSYEGETVLSLSEDPSAHATSSPREFEPRSLSTLHDAG